MKYFLPTLLFFSVVSCTQPENKKAEPLVTEGEKRRYTNLISFVNPFIGTQKMGHTFPGATAPFGMVQLSPETNKEVMFLEDGSYNRETYAYCSGYQYADSTIFGFSHTHFSGTGHSDLGDCLLMPTAGPLQLEPGDVAKPGSGYHSSFSHTEEAAEPGYYSVKLSDYGIDVELTASDRVGFHKYTFPKDDSAHVILDLMSNIYHHDNKNVWTFLRVENDSVVTGYRQTKGWARTRKVFFAMQFSRPISSYGHKKYDEIAYNGFYRKFDENKNFPEMAGRNLRAYFNFNTENNASLLVKFALSPVSTAGALANMKAEVPHWNFERIKKETQEKWNRELSKIEVETETQEQKQTFYTALYHTMLGPIVYEDVDGTYRGLDQNIHESDGFTNYTIFSLWDTYRALHPLFNITQPHRNNDMIKSMLAHQNESVHQMLPVWSHYANENWCMVGYHSVSVIADALAKGTTDANVGQLLQACDQTANVDYYDGLKVYKELGYVAEDESKYSVSKTLEYAYDDWCIAQIAQKAENTALHETYLERAKSYRNVYDPAIGYMRPKLSTRQWREEFDPLNTHGQGFIEGNAWNYGLYVPHELDTMIALMGGKDQFSSHLDRIFTTEIEERYIEKNEDITRDGIIGNYVHGNEPGHHIPYLYNWTNDAWKTQERVRMIVNTMYGNGADGLCGNDDAGQMSAWYVFSSLGFYPVLPGSNEYAIGSPSIKEAVVRLQNGKTFSIETVNQSETNVYVERIKLNGETLEGHTLLHEQILNGGTLTFYLSSTPEA
mgnify:FL=1